MPSQITSISPTPVKRGTSESFTVVVAPWDTNTPTYFPIFVYIPKDAKDTQTGFFPGKYADDDGLQRAIVDADIPMSAPIDGDWKLTFQSVNPKSGQLVIVIDSKSGVTFKVEA